MLNQEHCLCRSWIALVLLQGLLILPCVFFSLYKYQFLDLKSSPVSSIAGSLGVPLLNGSASNQQAISLPIIGQTAIGAAALPAPVLSSPAYEPIGQPSECLMLKNMFDPATEVVFFFFFFLVLHWEVLILLKMLQTEPDFDLDIKEDVEEECSKYGQVEHIFVDK
jgi:RNA-binding protein 39